MDNPNGSFQYIAIGTVGTVVARAVPASIHSFVPEVSVGTVTLYDTATAAGTSASNRIASFPGGTSAQDCFPRLLDIQTRNGLVYTSVGTPIGLLTLA